jgi:hypothetical protein
MAYTINLTDGTIFATVADGTINTDSSVTVVGKNYAGYGEFLNENFIKLLESNANTSQPSAPLTGQLWYDKTNSLLKVYSGTLFKNLGSATSATTAPSGQVAGDLWFDSTNEQLKVYNGTTHILVGPSFTAGSGTSGAIVETVQDGSAVDHVVVKMYVSSTVVSITSKDTTFTPAVSISGFATVVPGINISTTVSGAVLTGTSSNAQLLDSIDSTGFLSATGNDTTSGTLGVLNDTGVVVGADSDLKLSVATNDAVIQNQTSNGNILVKINDGGVTTTVLNIMGADGNINPGANNTINLGTTALQYKEIKAVTFTGLSSSAQYADLAERFEADCEMDPGTVVALGGSAEVTQASEDLSEEVFGVVSTHAAYLMNSNAGSNETHPKIALSGRTPVRVIGTVNKGDRLVSAGNGLARAAQSGETNSFNVIGRSLTNKYTTEEGTVEAIVAISH